MSSDLIDCSRCKHAFPISIFKGENGKIYRLCESCRRYQRTKYHIKAPAAQPLEANGKVCTKCNQYKYITDYKLFYKTGTYSKQCNTCNSYTQAYRSRVRDEHLTCTP